MTRSEYIRKCYSDRALAMCLVRERIDCWGKKIYYGHFEGTASDYLEAISKEENWLREETKEGAKNNG